MKKAGNGASVEQPEILWDLIDRCLLPLIFSHAAAVIAATVLNTLNISQISVISLFIIFLGLTMAVTLFYHNLKVTRAGKCIVLSGCETKIGYATAKYLDELGLTVFAGFQNSPDLKAKLKEECSGRLQVIDLDVTSDESVKSVLEKVKQYGQGAWAVVNAGKWSAFGETEWVPPSVFRKTLEINLLGVVSLTNAFLPLLRRSKGRVINIASILGRIPSGVRSPMCVVTSALDAYSDCLRLDLRRWGIDVVLVETGLTTTGAWYDNKAMLDEARFLWTSLTEDQRSDYGEDYFERQICTLKEYQSTNEDLSQLVKILGDAVTRTFPLARYTAVTRKEKIQALVAQHLPQSVYSVLYS